MKATQSPATTLKGGKDVVLEAVLKRMVSQTYFLPNAGNVVARENFFFFFLKISH